MDYLKTFTAGEKIKASEVNSNNQYLLDNIESSAQALRDYLELQIEQLQGNFVLPGFVIALPFDTIPTGYLKCDGSSLLRTDYSELFSAIGTIYGYADDYHFNLPNFQNKFLRGYGDKSASIGTAQTSAVPNITGEVAFPKIEGTNMFKSWSGALYRKSEGAGGDHQLKVAPENYIAKLGLDASKVSGVYKNVTEVRPDNYAVYWIIKY